MQMPFHTIYFKEYNENNQEDYFTAILFILILILKDVTDSIPFHTTSLDNVLSFNFNLNLNKSTNQS